MIVSFQNKFLLKGPDSDGLYILQLFIHFQVRLNPCSYLFFAAYVTCTSFRVVCTAQKHIFTLHFWQKGPSKGPMPLPCRGPFLALVLRVLPYQVKFLGSRTWRATVQ